MKRSLIWLGLALAMAVLLPFCALLAPMVLKTLFWKLSSDPAVAVLRGEYWGAVVRAVLLTIGPLVPVACFLLERVTISRARRQLAHQAFAIQTGREAFDRSVHREELWIPRGIPWGIYAVLCGIAVFLFTSGVRQPMLPQHIQEMGNDLNDYRTGHPAVYQGPLERVERQMRDGVREVPDLRFVYYDSAGESLRCAVTLLYETDLMQPSYTVTYLPETGTILTITDAEGTLRTTGADVPLPVPSGCWLYGDLAVPYCDDVPGYDTLTWEQQALFDLLYSEVFSGGVASGELSTRSFTLPYPLEKEAFNAVLELYESSVVPVERPTFGYRTDDGQMVEEAYCYGIHYSK